MIRSRSKNQFLFCPGPVIVAQNVFEAAINNIGHRETEFSTLLQSIDDKLLQLFQIKNKSSYQPLLITGSGTAANEAVISSIVGEQHILIISNGEFGERLVSISKIHNKNTHVLSSPWGEEMSLDLIEKYLKTKKVDIIAMVHHETSIGMLNPVEEIGKLTRKYKKTFYIDTVSSAGADKIDLEKWNVAFCTTSSGKAICSLPGLGIIVVRKSDIKKIKEIPAKTAYLNLYKIYEYSVSLHQTPNTPGVHLFYALDKALSNILEKGVERTRDEIFRKATLLRTEMKKMGLEFLIDEKNMSSTLTTLKIPEYTTFKKLRDSLKVKDIVVYNGKGPFLDKVFQVGNIGQLTDSNLHMFLESLKDALARIKLESVPRQSSRTFLSGHQTFFKFFRNHGQAI